MILPDFVLAGAPKCGTSSLFSWLNDHPALLGSTPKEPFYFMDRDHPLIDRHRNVHALGLKGWGELFPGGQEASDVLYFEGTTHLMYQETALSVLPSLPTRPKFLFLLRDPVARIESSFNYTRENLARVKGGLTLPAYVEMLMRGNTQEVSRYVTSEKSAFVLRRDLQYSDYWQYLSRWLEVVGRDRMMVLQLERLKREPLAVVREVCTFLGISPQFFEAGYDFSRKNATIALTNTALHRWAKLAARLIPSGRVEKALKRAYYAVQTRAPDTSDQAKLSDAAGRSLYQHFEAGNRELHEAFGLDLGLWGAPARHVAAGTPRAVDRAASTGGTRKS